MLLRLAQTTMSVGVGFPLLRSGARALSGASSKCPYLTANNASAALSTKASPPNHQSSAQAYPIEHAHAGSSYNDYDATSNVYDKFRVPIGLSIIKDSIQSYSRKHDIPTEKMRLLDAGCGSGNYLARLQGEVGEAIGLEFSSGMRAQAMSKGLEVHQGSITHSPFESNSFDIVITNLVLHHLEKGTSASEGQPNEGRFPNISRACNEINRILKPGGLWLINTQSPQQRQFGMWWCALIPDAAARLALHFPTLAQMGDMLDSANFSSSSAIIPKETVMPFDQYYRVEGAFDPAYRGAESTWSLASNDELQAGLDYLSEILRQGKREQFIQEQEAIRQELGQTTTIITEKTRL